MRILLFNQHLHKSFYPNFIKTFFNDLCRLKLHFFSLPPTKKLYQLFRRFRFISRMAFSMPAGVSGNIGNIRLMVEIVIELDQ